MTTETPQSEQPQNTDTAVAVQKKSDLATSAPKTNPPALQANEKGLLIGSSLEEQFRLAAAYCRSGLVPKAFDTPEKVLLGMQYARELGLQPITALRQIAIVNQVPNLWGDLPLSLVLKSEKLELIQETFFDKNNQPFQGAGDAFGAACKVKRKGIEGEVVRSFTMADAERAGLTSKDTWKKYPKRMLQCRARAWALKDLFPDILNGVAIMEYDHGTIPNADDPGQPINTRKSSLNDKFSEIPQTNVLTNGKIDAIKVENLQQ